jgi:hypothetical protein
MAGPGARGAVGVAEEPLTVRYVISQRPQPAVGLWAGPGHRGDIRRTAKRPVGRGLSHHSITGPVCTLAAPPPLGVTPRGGLAENDAASRSRNLYGENVPRHLAFRIETVRTG